MTHAPHDWLFKAVFQDPEHAAGELRHVLPDEIAAAIDWASLELESGSFVGDEGEKRRSDLLFSARVVGSDARVFVYLLFEHQSTGDVTMTLRLLEYMVRIWDREVQAHPEQPLPPIIPVVLAQVPGGWRAATRFIEMFSSRLAPSLQRLIPDYSYFIDDLCQTPDEALRQRALADFPKVALWLMRDARDIETLLERLTEWASAWEAIARAPNSTAAIFRLMHYLVMLFEQVHIDRFHAKLAIVAPTAKELAMTYGEQLLAEGMAKGKAEGRAEGKAEGMARGMLLGVLVGRKIAITEDAQRRIEQCTDLEQLERWSARAERVDHIEELFED